MKKLLFILSILFFSISSSFAQIIYSTGFEVANFGALGAANWTKTSAANTRVIVDNVGPSVAFQGNKVLALDETQPGGGAFNTPFAILHVDIGSNTEVILDFWWKSVAEEDDGLGDAVVDGVFFWDTITKGYVKVYEFPDEGILDTSLWYRQVMDVDELCIANGIALVDTMKIKFQVYTNNAVPTDGIYFDSLSLYVTPPFDAGIISGDDTVCSYDIASTNVNLNSLQDPLYGEGTHTYTWESSINLLVWNTLATNTNVSETFPAPLVNTYYRRCVSTDSGQAACSSPILVVIDDQVVTVSGVTSMSVSDPATVLVGSPTNANGVFTGGAGLTNNGDGTANFDPATAGIGPFAAIYTYTTSNGCVFKDTLNITVSSSTVLLPGVISGADTICTDSLPYPSVTMSSVTLGTGGTGTIQYQWESSTDLVNWSNMAGETSSSSTFLAPYQTSYYRRVTTTSNGNGPVYSNIIVLSVSDNPFVLLSTFDDALCIDGDTVAITSYSSIGNAGVYNSLGGLIDNTDGTASFDPGPGNLGSNDIVYTVTNNFGCSSSDTLNISVNNLPSITFPALSLSYQSTNAPIILTATPIGGNYSGLAISGGAFFPAIAPIDSLVTLTYTYTDSNGCVNNASVFTTVTLGINGAINTSLLTDYCESDNALVALSGNPPSGWTSVGFTSNSPGLTNFGSSATFNPSLANLDTLIEITFTFSQNYACNPYPCSPYLCSPYNCNPYVCITGYYSIFGISIPIYGTCWNTCWNICYQTCWNTCTRFQSVTVNTTVHSLPTVSIQNVDTAYCRNAPIFTLQGNNSPAGSFFSNPIGLLQSANTALDPSTIPSVISTFDIGYTYTDLYGCKDTVTQSVNLDTVPNIFFGEPLASSSLPNSICVNDAPITLTGNETTNSFFTAINGLTNVSPGIATFDPSAPAPGFRYLLEYNYSNGDGCFAKDTHSIMLHDKPVVDFVTLNNHYCTDDSIITLFGSPTGGIFSGSIGVTDFTGDTGFLDPTAYTLLDTVVNTVTYTFTDINNCTNFIDKTTIVRSLPNVSFTGLNPEYCESDGLINLAPTPTTGGLFTATGLGIAGYTFTPSTAGSGNHSITLTYTDGFGCSNDSTLSTIVHSLPMVLFSGLNDTVCADEPAMQLIGNQNGGQFLRVNTFPLPYDTVLYLADNYDITSNVINDFFIYNYVDSNGCFNADTQSYTVNPLPVLQFSGLLPSYCEDDLANGLFGSLTLSHPYAEDTSYFIGTGIIGTAYNPTIVPLGGNVQVDDTVYFVFVDIAGCRDTVFESTEIHALPNVSFFYPPGTNFSGTIAQDSLFCETETFVALGSTPTFGTGNSSSFSLISGGALSSDVLNPSALNTGIDTLVYTYEDGDGCINYDTNQFTIYPSPQVDFVLGSFCNDDSISFYDSSVIVPFFNGNANNDVILDWFWQFGDGGDDTIQNPKHQYIIPTNYTIYLTATTREGCSAIYNEQHLIGEPPKADFSWDNVCFGEILQLSDLSTFQLVDPIFTWSWDFNDGNFLDNSVGGNLGSDPVQPVDNNGGITDSTYQNPSHIFQMQRTHYVSLALATGSGCLDTITRAINIKPVIDILSNDPYIQPFDSLNSGWFPGGSTNGIPDIYTWAWGDAAGSVINDQGNGNKSWGTNLSGDHANIEQSYLDGPCFNFDSVIRPMIKLDYWADMQEGNDGAVLQWTDDNGVNWNTVGDIGDGINWYNTNSIGGNPGNQSISQVGWSYQDTAKAWIEGRHDLDTLVGKRLVRIRIAFGADAQGSNEGVGFDNVWIGERSRVTLLEYFTNSAESGSIQDDADMDALVIRNRKDVVDIQYHTEFPGNDEMNNHNPADPSARALYYGAFNVGRATLNGNAYNGVSSNVTDNNIKLQMLRDSPYSLTVRKDFTNSNADIMATAYLEARKDLDSSDVTLHIVVIEKQITAITGDNGDTEFRSVLKKMMPAASGTVFTKDWLMNEQKGVSETWTMQNVFDVNNLEIVAFVQDNVTKEVYQVSTTDTVAVPPVVVPPLTVEELIVQDVKFRMFPNPTNRELTVLFNQFVDSPVIIFYDQLGREMNYFKTNGMMEYITFELDYPAGIYYVKTIVGDEIKTQKLIISK